MQHTFDNFAKSPICFLLVIPAKAGIQWFQVVMDSRFRGSDSVLTFYKTDKFSFILRVIRGYIFFGCGSAALCTLWLEKGEEDER